MKSFVSGAVAALLATTTLAQSGSGSLFDESWGSLIYAYDVPLTYETTYYSGIGPYYSDNIFTGIDDTMHYEEYGFLFSFYATGYIGMIFGDTTAGTDVYNLIVEAEVDVLEITPYKQVVWFQRPVSNMMENGVSEIHAWVGAAYQVATGEAFMSYTESAYTGIGDLWTGGAWTERPSYTDASYPSSWDDPIYHVNVVDYLPAEVQQWITEYEIYSAQMF